MALIKTEVITQTMLDSDRKRRAPVAWRPPIDRWDEFDARVSASGLSRNAFITEAVFGRSRHRPAELLKLAELLAQCAVIADELRKYDPAGSESSAIKAQLSDARDRLTEIRAAILREGGRQP